MARRGAGRGALGDAGVLAAIVGSQFAGTALWFAPNAVLAQVPGFGDRELAALTSLVQVGFILGTLAFTLSALTDRFPATVLFALCSAVGAAFNALCVTTTSFPAWAALRALVGFALAGVYPVGMKIAASQFPDGLGARLGVLVGALTLGTAIPWFIRGVGSAMPWETTLLAVTALALAGGALMLLAISTRADRSRAAGILCLPFCCSAKHQVSRNDAVNGAKGPALVLGRAGLAEIWACAEFRSAALGYWGHMWELYAFWAYVPVLADAHQAAVGEATLSVPLTSFLAIAIGAVSCTAAGILSLYVARGRFPGSAVTALTALAVSGLCCAVVPAYRRMTPAGFLAFVLVWGAAVVADSAQFSALCARYAPAHLVGTALTLTTCVGFTITVVSIQAVGAAIRGGIDPGVALSLLLPGPILGCAAGYCGWPRGTLSAESRPPPDHGCERGRDSDTAESGHGSQFEHDASKGQANAGRGTLVQA